MPKNCRIILLDSVTSPLSHKRESWDHGVRKLSHPRACQDIYIPLSTGWETLFRKVFFHSDLFQIWSGLSRIQGLAQSYLHSENQHTAYCIVHPQFTSIAGHCIRYLCLLSAQIIRRLCIEHLLASTVEVLYGKISRSSTFSVV